MKKFLLAAVIATQLFGVQYTGTVCDTAKRILEVTALEKEEDYGSVSVFFALMQCKHYHNIALNRIEVDYEHNTIKIITDNEIGYGLFKNLRKKHVN